MSLSPMGILGKILGITDLIFVGIIWTGWIDDWIFKAAFYFVFKGLFFLFLSGFSITNIFSWTDFIHGILYTIYLITGLHSDSLMTIFLFVTTAKALWSML